MLTINGNKYSIEQGTNLNGERIQYASFPTKVIDISENVLHLKNEAQTPYRIATVQFTDSTGVERTVTSMMWDKSYGKGVIADGGEFDLSKDRLCTITYTEGRPQPSLVTSHLTAGARATVDMFDGFISFDSADEAQPEVADAEGELVEDLDDLVG
jgi:hypothetical protein